MTESALRTAGFGALFTAVMLPMFMAAVDAVHQHRRRDVRRGLRHGDVSDAGA
jgi:hypothetical protein